MHDFIFLRFDSDDPGDLKDACREQDVPAVGTQDAEQLSEHQIPTVSSHGRGPDP